MFHAHPKSFCILFLSSCLGLHFETVSYPNSLKSFQVGFLLPLAPTQPHQEVAHMNDLFAIVEIVVMLELCLPQQKEFPVRALKETVRCLLLLNSMPRPHVVLVLNLLG